MAEILSFEFNGNTLHLRVHAPRLDAAAARDFKTECAGIWRASIERVVIDLSEVGFVDSSGIGALLSVYKRLAAEKPNVRLTNVQPPVQSVIELLRMHRIFEVQS